MLGDQSLDMGQGVGVEENFTATAVVKDRNRHTPGALTRNAPVTPLLDHRFDPVTPGCRGPLHRVDGIEGLFSEAVHRGEPLFGGAENRGLFGAPVVGISVAVVLLLEQCAGLRQRFDDCGVGVLEYVQPRKWTRFCGEGAGFINGAEHRQSIFQAGVKVIDSMAWSGVHQPCSGLSGDVVTADHHRTGAIHQWMPIDQVGKQGTFDGGAAVERKRQCRREGVDQISGHQQQTALSIVGQGVIQPFVHGYRQVGWQGPWGGGPDRHLKGLAEFCRIIGEFDALSFQGVQ